MPCPVFLEGTHVNDERLAFTHPADQLIPTNRLRLVQFGNQAVFRLFQPDRLTIRQHPQRPDELAHLGNGETITGEEPFLRAIHQPGAQEHLKVLGGVRNGLAERKRIGAWVTGCRFS